MAGGADAGGPVTVDLFADNSGVYGANIFRQTYSTFTSDDPVGNDTDLVSVDIVSGGGAVPEPAAWALMVFGFGGAGAALRRRRLSLTI